MSDLLVLDLGTTYFKFARFDRAGRLCDSASLAPPLESPEKGRLELDAHAFAEVLAQGIGRLRQRAGGEWAQVEAVTFATQTNSFLLLDAELRPLTRIVLWPDRRAAEIEDEIRQRAEIPGLASTTGVPAVNPCFLIAKLLWLRRHVREACERAQRLCLVSDYLGWLMTGQLVTEAGAAALTALVDIAHCRWWPEMLARMELDERLLPAVVRAGTDLGPIRAAVAEQFGLPRSCRFIVGCLDQYAGAIGAGNVTGGLISETTGTVLATVIFADQPAADLGPSVFQGPAFVEGSYYRMAFGDVSANYLEWYRNSLPDRPDFEALTAAAKDVALGADGLRLNTAHPPTTPEEVFQGWTAGHTRGHAVRAILEAVAVALREQVRAVCRGAEPTEVRSAGGAARSELWLQIKADVLGVPFRSTQCPEPTSLGAAILAEAALAGASVPEIARRWVRLGDPYRPNPANHRRYQAIYPQAER
jgi:xylulokinase